ncbi:GNAT family N-acetyltransferase [Allostreptomyces psammosilenae]|uniref:RimJ/RimL family protein N-acetyltransferase n=1 Tax=Allostreptomyces psammosilenae TaxID=1892865 RepID=A0A852ZVR7_9ACTN|nr:GNAT family protein [Allostreptomyces psammosilenae]NYI04874.1 RimJ/RimL family protein N-acetyltransferase [Allostreptomyces psammosilenae]
MVAKTPVPTVLTGRHVRLEPVTEAHIPELFAAGGQDPEVWRWLSVPTPMTEEELLAAHRSYARQYEAGTAVGFAVVDLAGGRAVGWTHYLDIDPVAERLEIGATWYGRAHWRTATNTEAKLLLLTHAFDDLGMGRVELRTDHRNTRSQAAISRLGAVREGTLRRHRRRPDGTWRDTVVFSLLASEWPATRDRLTARLARG